MTDSLGFLGQFSVEDAENMRRGIVPNSMDDKWFIYFESGWLRFHRSWTGAFIYALQLQDHEGGVRVLGSWVNRDPAQYKPQDLAYDRELVAFLIDALLLGKTGLAFPLPKNVPSAAPGVLQHNLIGRGFPETRK